MTCQVRKNPPLITRRSQESANLLKPCPDLRSSARLSGRISPWRPRKLKITTKDNRAPWRAQQTCTLSSCFLPQLKNPHGLPLLPPLRRASPRGTVGFCKCFAATVPAIPLHGHVSSEKNHRSSKAKKRRKVQFTYCRPFDISESIHGAPHGLNRNIHSTPVPSCRRRVGSSLGVSHLPTRPCPAASTWITDVDFLVHLHDPFAQVLPFRSLDAFLDGLTTCVAVRVLASSHSRSVKFTHPFSDDRIRENLLLGLRQTTLVAAEFSSWSPIFTAWLSTSVNLPWPIGDL